MIVMIKKRKSNNNTIIEKEICTSHQQPKIDKINNDNDNNLGVSANENHRQVNIGPNNVGRTYYMLKVLEKRWNKITIHIISRSPNQYPNYITSDEIKAMDKYKGSVVIFDKKLRVQTSSRIANFYTRRRHENLNVFYIGQSYFALPRQSIGNNSNRKILFKQKLRDVQSMDYDIGAYDMLWSEFKETCRRAWSEKNTYLTFDFTKNKIEGRYRFFNESTNT